ncbi:MAG: radical SAM protein, partial [Flavobacteriales bacterium]
MAAGKRMLLATATPAKAMNLLLLFASYQWSRLLGKPLHRGMPASISIEPTTACNLRCPECTSGLRQFTRPQGNMKMETFRTVIDQLGSKLLFLNLYFQGEPFIHPEFLQMVEYAAGKNIYTCTSTNGHFISGDVARQT